ncbi:hypothetical protein [Mucilaginibacter sp. NFR10]|uniref:hypothetical protein n=1 Tax=Mucilaginibacter sp. NFR10 TaxID=1566292 RepID=UPI000B837B49|nr:hypothetical protein [Mucilaginibacter sp. NFR10]
MYIKPMLFLFILFLFLDRVAGQEKHQAEIIVGKPAGRSSDLYLKRSFIIHNQIGTRTDTNYANAKLIRTGWDDGIFKTNPGFYRHDLVSRVPIGFAALSETDRRMFIITINQDSVRQMKDTVCYSDGKLHRCLYAVIPVTLSNQSPDTLKYINMSCAWLDVFKTDAGNVKFLPTPLMEECWKNNPAVYTVAPHQQKVFHIPTAFLTDTGKGGLFESKVFKIGMCLYKYIEGSQLPVDIRGLTLRQETDNIIWSNEIAVR